MDEYLWKDLFYAFWKIPLSVLMAHGKSSWQAEFKRLYYHTPKVSWLRYEKMYLLSTLIHVSHM